MKITKIIQNCFADYPQKTIRNQLISLFIIVAIMMGALVFILTQINFGDTSAAAAPKEPDYSKVTAALKKIHNNYSGPSFNFPQTSDKKQPHIL